MIFEQKSLELELWQV